LWDAQRRLGIKGPGRRRHVFDLTALRRVCEHALALANLERMYSAQWSGRRTTETAWLLTTHYKGKVLMRFGAMSSLGAWSS
jgi:hypothetical protein